MKPVTLFVSYSQKDIKWLELISEHLAPLENEGLIEAWDDREIRAGSETKWEEQLLPKLEQAGIIVMLLSSAFSASNYIQHVELPLALERKRNGTARVYFVLVRPYDIEQEILQFQILPEKRSAISSMADQDAACEAVVKKIREDLAGAPAPKPVPAVTQVQPVSTYLPYLCDRFPHETPIRLELAKRPTRPVVAMIPGRRLEAHEGFHARLEYYSLPKPVTRCSLEWPRDTAPDVLTYEIAFTLSVQGCDPKAVNQLLPEGLTLFTVSAPCDRWDGEVIAVLKSLLAYWSEWPDLGANRLLCVCISISWTAKGPSRSVVQSALAQSDFPNLRLVVTPELDSPTEDQVAKWLGLPQIRAVYNPDCSLQLNASIARLFQRRRVIPMEHLHPPLLQALKDHPSSPHAHTT